MTGVCRKHFRQIRLKEDVKEFSGFFVIDCFLSVPHTIRHSSFVGNSDKRSSFGSADRVSV